MTKSSFVVINYVNLTYKLPPRDKLRLDQAFEKLKERGCVRSRKEMIVKTAYFVLLKDIDELCEVFGQSVFSLERTISGNTTTNTTTNTKKERG